MAAGNVYVADGANNLIRKITPAGVVQRWPVAAAAGNADGTGVGASFNSPVGVAVDKYGEMFM